MHKASATPKKGSIIARNDDAEAILPAEGHRERTLGSTKRHPLTAATGEGGSPGPTRSQSHSSARSECHLGSSHGTWGSSGASKRVGASRRSRTSGGGWVTFDARLQTGTLPFLGAPSAAVRSVAVSRLHGTMRVPRDSLACVLSGESETNTRITLELFQGRQQSGFGFDGLACSLLTTCGPLGLMLACSSFGIVLMLLCGEIGREYRRPLRLRTV